LKKAVFFQYKLINFYKISKTKIFFSNSC